MLYLGQYLYLLDLGQKTSLLFKHSAGETDVVKPMFRKLQFPSHVFLRFLRFL